MKTNLTKKQVSSLTSKDGLKPALNGLYYEPSKKRLTATNGHALISYNVESCKNESTAIIPTEVFKTKAKDNCKYYINGEASRISDEGKANYNLIDEKFPNYESVRNSYYLFYFEKFFGKLQLDLYLLYEILQINQDL